MFGAQAEKKRLPSVNFTSCLAAQCVLLTQVDAALDEHNQALVATLIKVHPLLHCREHLLSAVLH